jgi:prepilin-type N-terminal cleavage/methylation domain-containing protein
MEMKTLQWRDGLRPVPKFKNATEGVPPGSGDAAFTLIELVIVIVIIAVLVGLAFPVFQGVQNQAKRVQAKNDVTQIVTAVNAYYTEYGKYPLLDSQVTANSDALFGGGSSPTNEKLFNVLRMPLGFADSQNPSGPQNPRKIGFISPPDVKNPSNPRAGIAAQDTTVNGISVKAGEFVDPWGTPYAIKIDGDYSNRIETNPYSLNAGSSTLQAGVIAWSFGKDQQSQTIPGPAANKNSAPNSDDVISWQ